jgi:hypothetical protein
LAGRRERIAPDAFVAALQGFELLDRDRNLKLFGADHGGLEQSFRVLSDRMRESGLSTSALDPHVLYGRLLAESL